MEGLLLNLNDTFDTDREWRYLRVDLIDENVFDTVTLVTGSSYYPTHPENIIVGACICVEEAVVVPRTANGDGSIHFSLQIDATTSITLIPPSTAKLFFVPELSITVFSCNLSSPDYRRCEEMAWRQIFAYARPSHLRLHVDDSDWIADDHGFMLLEALAIPEDRWCLRSWGGWRFAQGNDRRNVGSRLNTGGCRYKTQSIYTKYERYQGT